MIEIIYILCFIIIIKSEVWIITHYLGLGHETVVCAVCLFVFFLLSNTIGHISYVTSSSVHYFIAICKLKLEIQSGNAQIGAQFVLTYVTLTFDLWPWPFASTSLWSMVMTPEYFMMILWQEHNETGVTDGQTDRHTDRRTERSVLRAAWLQLKKENN